MDNQNNIPHTQVELIEAYKKVVGNEENVRFFINEYHTVLQEFIEFPEPENTPKERALNFCIEIYLPIFLKQIEKGHSPRWAHECAINAEEGDKLIFDTYRAIKKINKLWAQNELILHCKSIGIKDPIQINHFIYVMDDSIGEGFIKGTKKAELFSEHFNKEIENNKSILFASIYAQEKSGHIKNYGE